MNLLTRRMKLTINLITPILIVCLCITCINGQPIDNSEDKYPSFKEFLLRYHKSYNLKAEYSRRYQIYNENIYSIRLSNCKSCGVNFYADWTYYEIKKLRNVKYDYERSKIAAMPINSERRLSEGLVSAFDWRDVMAFTDVKDSGYCGAGYAFSTIAYFYQDSILAGTANSSINLSYIYIMACSPYSTACIGGNIYSSIDLIINNGGIPYENKYPYYPVSPPTPSICFESNVFKTPRNISRMSYYNVKDQEIIKLLLRNKPIVVAICAKDLAFYSPYGSNNDNGSRTLKCNPNNRVIDHAVLLVGYTYTEWIIKNSWGQHWGINGYAYISRNPAQDCCIGDQLHTTGQITTNCAVYYCQTCVYTTTCSKCQYGRYVFYNTTTGVQTCELCTYENCKYCYNYMGSCKWCVDGFAINKTSGKCVTSAVANCNTFKKTNCVQCKPGYILVTNKLCSIYCSVYNCANCTSGPCTMCRPGYSLLNTTTSNGTNIQYCLLNNCTIENCLYCDQTGAMCLQCKYSYLLNITTGTCYTNCTITNCINCLNGSTTCNYCIAGLSYNSTQKVCENFTSTTNCKIHKTTTCTTCRTGYTLSTTKLCVQNCNGCSTCLYSNPYQCLTCPISSSLSMGMYSATCVANPCNISNCKSCYVNATCMTCVTNYLVYNSTSNKCYNQCALANCRDCLPNATTCAYCNPGYAVSYTTRLCVQTNITSCILIDSVNSKQVCYTCEASFYLNSANTYCLIYCIDYYCYSCNLSTLFICTKCFDGFYMMDLYGGRTCTYIYPMIPRCYYVSYNQSYCYLCDEYSVWNPTTGSCDHNTTSCPDFCYYCGNNQVSTFICRCKQSGYVFDVIKHICFPNPMTTTPNCTIIELYMGVYYCLYCTEGLIPDKNNINCISPCTVLNCTYCGNGFPTSCVECNVGFYLDELNQCQKCMTNCKTCISAKCTSCYPGFQIYNNGLSCSPIVCADGYFFDGFYCACPVGTYYANLTCLPCVEINCKYCTQYQCFSCQYGYFVSQNQCINCPVNCKHCTIYSSCIVCQDGYILDASTMLCINPALTGASYSVSSTAVVKCPVNCMICDNQSICSQCAPGYTVVGSMCLGCQGTCKTCYPGNVSACLSCTNGYYMEGVSCVKCNVSNCFNCELMASICAMCYEGFYLNNGSCVKCTGENCIGCNYLGKCTKCSSGYALMNDFTCQQCACNCKSCNSTAINQCITVCNMTSYLSNNTCVSCPSQCQTCTSDSICLSCSQGYILQNTTCKKPCAYGCYNCDSSNPSKCLQCIVGYSLAVNYTCSIDITCNDNNSCTICPANWSLINGSCYMCNNIDGNCVQCANNNITLCVYCKIGFFLVNGTCVVCNEACLTCSQQDRCLLCKYGFYLPINIVFANCSACDPMCKTCVDYTDKCTSCNIGYELTVTDTCLRVYKANATVTLNLAIESFPTVSRYIRSAIIGLIGAYFINQTKLYIITGLEYGSTILSFTVSIPDGQDAITIYNKLKGYLTTVRQLGGTYVIAVTNVVPVNINFEPLNTINDTNTNNNNNLTTNNNNNNLTHNYSNSYQYKQVGGNTKLAIILGVVIPSVVIILLVGGYCIRKKYFYNKIYNESYLEFRDMCSYSMNQGKLTSQESKEILANELKYVYFDERGSNHNQTNFNTTYGYPQYSSSTLSLSTKPLKIVNKTSINNNNDNNSYFNRTLHNIVSTLNNNQEYLSSQLSTNNNQNFIINDLEEENLSYIKEENVHIYPTMREVRAGNSGVEKMFFPYYHNNEFFYIEEPLPQQPEQINPVSTIPVAINPRMEVVDFEDGYYGSYF